MPKWGKTGAGPTTVTKGQIDEKPGGRFFTAQILSQRAIRRRKKRKKEIGKKLKDRRKLECSDRSRHKWGALCPVIAKGQKYVRKRIIP